MASVASPKTSSARPQTIVASTATANKEPTSHTAKPISPPPPPIVWTGNIEVPLMQSDWARPNVRSWLFWITLLAIAFVIGYIFYEYSPNQTLASASVVAWIVLLATWVVLWLLARSIVWTLISVIIHLRKTNSIRVMLTNAYFSACYLLWSVLISIGFQVVFDLNPFPARKNGTTTSLNKDTVWWLRRLFLINVFLGLLLVLRSLALIRLRFGTRMIKQAAAVKEALRAEQVLQQLTYNLAPVYVLTEKRRKLKESDTQLTQYAAAVMLQNLWRFRKRKKKTDQESDKSKYSPSSSHRRQQSQEADKGPSRLPHSNEQTSNQEPPGPTTNIQTAVDVHTGGYAREGAELRLAMSNTSQRQNNRRSATEMQSSKGVKKQKGKRHDTGSNDYKRHTCSSCCRARRDNECPSDSDERTRDTKDRHQPVERAVPVNPRETSDTNSLEVDIDTDWREQGAQRYCCCRRKKRYLPTIDQKRAANATILSYSDDAEGLGDLGATLLAGFESIRFRYITVCRHRIALKNAKLAQRLGEALFDRYAVGGEVAMTALRSDLLNEESYAAACNLFDPFGRQRADEAWMRDRVEKIYRDRKNLAITLNDLESITHALGSFLTAAVVVLMLFALNIAFSTGDYAEVTVTVGTTLFALSFIFADSARNLFNSFVFLFVQHPFDVGDRIVVPGWDPMYVVRLELMLTTFVVWDGRIVTIPNFVLHSLTIVNIQRSERQFDPLAITIDIDTPWWKIEELEKVYRSFLRSKPNDFIESGSGFFVRNMNSSDGNSLSVHFFTQEQTNFQNGEHVPRMHALIRVVKEACEDLGIKYHRPKERVQVSGINLPSGSSAIHPTAIWEGNTAINGPSSVV